MFAFCCWEHGDPLPDGKGGLQQFETVPDSLYWKRYVDSYGLPNGGGWTDQPRSFMRDISAAAIGEKMERSQREIDEKKLFLNAITDIRDLLSSGGK